MNVLFTKTEPKTEQGLRGINIFNTLRRFIGVPRHLAVKYWMLVATEKSSLDVDT